MSKKVLIFGEIMLLVSTLRYSRFVQSLSFDVTYGSGEASVVVSLANCGLESFFLTIYQSMRLDNRQLVTRGFIVLKLVTSSAKMRELVFNFLKWAIAKRL